MAQLLERYANPKGGIVDLEKGLKTVKEVMWMNGAIGRSAERCAEGLRILQELEDSFDPIAHMVQGKDARGAVELHNCIQVAKVLLTVMDFRKESRGSHYRLDYPEKDPAYHGYITITKREGKLHLELTRTDV